MAPKRIMGDKDTPSTSIDEYNIPTELPEEVRRRLANFEDLCQTRWE